MFKLHKSFLGFLFLCSSFTVFSQGVIVGKIIDDANQMTLEYASVRIFSIKDSSVVAGIYTSENGEFVLEQVPYGKYYAKITFAGYEVLQIDNLSLSSSVTHLNLGTLKLRKDKTQNLEEVKIVANIDVLKAGIDKKVYNVDEDLSVKGGTANDVLNNLPSVEVDQDGRITLRGEGTVTILIDGRPSSLSGGNGKTLLDALPAGSIERIEIVNNPSAKYDPDGTSGIINIVLKKNKLRGFNGLITANAGSGNLKSGNVADGSIILGYRNPKMNLYLNYSGRYLEGYRNNYSNLIQQFSSDSSVTTKQTREGTDLNAGNTFRFGSDFYLKNRQFFSVSTTGSNGVRTRTGDQWNTQKDQDSNLIRIWRRSSDDPSNNLNLDVNLNYKYEFKEDLGNIVVDLNQSYGNSETKGYYIQTEYLNTTTPANMAVLKQQLFNTEKNNITTAQFDLTKIYPKLNARIETGVKAIVRQQGVDTYSESLDTLSGVYTEDTLANFLYEYNEQVYSFYGIFGQQRNKWKYQGGIRLEQAYQIPNLISDTAKITNDYFNFFPSVHVRYSLKEKAEISLSYSKRINRASADDLNPFTSYADPLNLRKGNPYLQPEYIDSYDLGYSNVMKKITLTAAVFYRHTTGVITRVKEYYVNNTSAVTFANLDQSNSTGAEIVLVYKPVKWFRNTISINGNYTSYRDDNTTANWNVSGTNWNAKYSGTIDFWKKTASIQINAQYNAPRVTVQGRAQRKGPFNISFEKSLADGKWNVGGRVTDIFNQQGFEMEINQPGITQTSEFKWLTRRFFVTCSYKFGKLELSNKNRGSNFESGGDM